MSRWEKRRSRGRLSALLSVVASALAGLAAFSALADGPAPVDGIVQVEVTPVPLDASDPSRAGVGPFQYLGGLWLRSADPRFGGFSDVRVSADGSRVTTVSDCGSGFTARLGYDEAGRLTGLSDARLVALTSPSGSALERDEIDAESLIVDQDGGLEVGFEGHARVQKYGPDFAGPAQAVSFPGALAQCGRNGGLELMADAGDGKRLLVCEERRGRSTTVPAWVGAGESWAERTYPLKFDGGWAGEPFRPTAAARLGDGDLLIVERRFPPLAARLVLLSRTALEAAGTLETRELARLEAPLTLDNIEGVDVRKDARGRTLVYLLSDDNNCAKRPGAARTGVQRTLLLLFVLAG
jgi:hypothetical protein